MEKLDEVFPEWRRVTARISHIWIETILTLDTFHVEYHLRVWVSSVVIYRFRTQEEVGNLDSLKAASR